MLPNTRRQGFHPIFVAQEFVGNRLHRSQTQKPGKMDQRAPGVATAYFLLV